MCVGGQVVLYVVATYSIRSCSLHFAAMATVVRHYIAPVRAYNLLVCFEHVQNKRSGSAIKVVHVDPLSTLCRSWLVVTVSNSSPIRSQRPYVAFSRDFPFLWSHGERSGSYPLVWQGGKNKRAIGWVKCLSPIPGRAGWQCYCFLTFPYVKRGVPGSLQGCSAIPVPIPLWTG